MYIFTSFSHTKSRGDSMISIWSDSVEFPSFEQLKKDIKTDVLIIGGGITGILCAHILGVGSVWL